MKDLKKRMYIIEASSFYFPADLGKYLVNHNIQLHMTGFIESPHRIVTLTKSELRDLKAFSKEFPVQIRKGM